MKNFTVLLFLVLTVLGAKADDAPERKVIVADKVSSATVLKASHEGFVVKFSNKNRHAVKVFLLMGYLQKRTGDRWESLNGSFRDYGPFGKGAPSSVVVNAGKTVELKFNLSYERELGEWKKGDELKFTLFHQQLERDAPGKNSYERGRAVTSGVYKSQEDGVKIPVKPKQPKRSK